MIWSDFLSYPVLLSALFGLLFGSFLNVCIYRIPRDLSVIAPRSFCPECGATIVWYDNLPVLSYVLLRGRCRRCRHPIGIRYPLVEIVTSLLVAITVAKYGWTPAALKWTLFQAIMIALFGTDLEERILPDELTLGGAICGLALSFWIRVPGELGPLLWPSVSPPWSSFFSALLGACVIAIPMFLLGLAYRRFRHREGIGLGDLKLLLLLGSFLGVEHGVEALLIASIAGSIVGLLFILITRKDASNYWLPFGSFLCAAASILPLISKQ